MGALNNYLLSLPAGLNAIRLHSTIDVFSLLCAVDLSSFQVGLIQLISSLIVRDRYHVCGGNVFQSLVVVFGMNDTQRSGTNILRAPPIGQKYGGLAKRRNTYRFGALVCKKRLVNIN